MRLRAALLPGSGSRPMFNQTANGMGWTSAPNSSIPLVNQISYPVARMSPFIGGGTTENLFLLLQRPIKLGAADRLAIDISFIMSDIGGGGVTAKLRVTLMTTPLTWNPFLVTYAAQPAINQADDYIEQQFTLAARGDPNSIRGLDKQFVIDLTKIKAPVVGFAAACTQTAGTAGDAVLRTDCHLTAFTGRAPIRFSVHSRSAYHDGVTGLDMRRLYLPAGSVAAFFASPYYNGATHWVHQNLYVQGVGNPADDRYDNDLFSGNSLSAVWYYDASADTIDVVNAGAHDGFTEGVTACGGACYYNI